MRWEWKNADSRQGNCNHLFFTLKKSTGNRSPCIAFSCITLSSFITLTVMRICVVVTITILLRLTSSKILLIWKVRTESGSSGEIWDSAVLKYTTQRIGYPPKRRESCYGHHFYLCTTFSLSSFSKQLRKFCDFTQEAKITEANVVRLLSYWTRYLRSQVRYLKSQIYLWNGKGKQLHRKSDLVFTKQGCSAEQRQSPMVRSDNLLAVC